MDKILNDLKNEYNSINCSEKFIERIENVMKKEKKRRIFALGTVAAAAAVVIATVNIVPEIPVAAQEIPVIKEIVNVLTFGRFKMQKNGYEAEIVTPEITGLMDKELEKKLNDEFKENADIIKKQYLADVADLKNEFGDETVHMGLKMDYKVLTNNDRFLSMDVYVFSVAASGYTKHNYYNIDKKNNKLLTLDEVYKNDPDYKNKLISYIKSEMKRRNEEEEGMFFLDGQFAEDTEKALNGVNKFYINNDGNVMVCFDKYEIAAGAQGSPEFEIPETVIKPSL